MNLWKLVERADRLVAEEGWKPVEDILFGESIRIYKKGKERMLFDIYGQKEIITYTVN
ncbi:MAG: hypothetical protein J7L43_01455 [Candidatus Aenigmarchaeota archaeon]|nr:hypothetical protein [Candidatus Aenigmarchaeota archaeon]